MNIKKGDKVIVIAGNYKGKEGIVQVVHPRLNKVVVENINVRKKHRKPTQKNPEGSIVEIYAPIDASNVMLIDPKTKKPTRVGHKEVK
ncbi:MAG: 50S ribosomal protein L24, partial [Bacilli bacterium]